MTTYIIPYDPGNIDIPEGEEGHWERESLRLLKKMNAAVPKASVRPYAHGRYATGTDL